MHCRLVYKWKSFHIATMQLRYMGVKFAINGKYGRVKFKLDFYLTNYNSKLLF